MNTNTNTKTISTPWYALIAVLVTAANLIAVWGPKVLLCDDAVSYYWAVRGEFPYFFIQHGSILGSITEWSAWNIMTYSPQLIRFIYILFLMIPLSIVFFRFLYQKFRLPLAIGITASIIPNILPYQWTVPGFTNGSYVIPNLLLTLLALMAGFRYLNQDENPKTKWLITAALIYLAATQLYDNAVFLYPSMILAALCYRKWSKRTLYLISSYTASFLIKIAWLVLSPRGAAEVVRITTSEIIDRFRYYFLTILPFPYRPIMINYKICFAVVSLILGIGLWLYLSKKSPDENSDENTNKNIETGPFYHLKPRNRKLFIVAFFLCWTTCSIFPFIFMSKFSGQVRYGYIAAFGFNTLFIIALYSIISYISRENKKVISAFFILLILFAGISHQTMLNKTFSKLNEHQAAIQKGLNRFSFPPQSQIVIYYNAKEKWKASYWGTWEHSCGHLKYMLKNDTLEGLLLSTNEYFSFAGLKNLPIQNLNWSISWLKWKNPLFVFLYNKGEFKQYRYALEMKKRSGQFGWKIYRLDEKSGKAQPLISGTGFDEYKEAISRLKEQNITESDILWAVRSLP